MKRISIFVYTLLISCAAAAQQKAELRLSGGYGLSTSHGNEGSAADANSSVNASLGRGFALAADATWWFNGIIGVTAGASYKTTHPAIKTIDYSLIPSDGPGYNSSWQARVAYAVAGIALKVPDTKLNPYARIGVLLPVYKHITENTDWSASNFGGLSYGTFIRDFYTANTLGYKAAIGIQPSLTRHLALFAEINLEASQLRAQRSTITDYTSKGVDITSTLSASARETVYVKNINTALPLPRPDQPSQEQQFSFPFGNIGLNIGIAIKL